MRSVSYSNSLRSISISICSSARSISWAKSCSYDGSPCLPDANYFDESTTYMGIVSSICIRRAPCYTCYCCGSFSCLHKSYSFKSCSFNPCNSIFVSSILLFSLCLCAFHLLHCFLFTSITITSFSTSRSAWNLQLCSSSMQLTIFLLPLSCTSVFTYVSATAFGGFWDATSGAFWDAASGCFASNSTMKLTSSLILEEL